MNNMTPQTSKKPTALKPATLQHVHPEHGPHQGELIEIGKEEYHAEMIVDEEKKELTIYLLDQQAKSYVAIDALTIAVNFVAKGKPVQVKLKSTPQEVDQKGLSSRFVAASPELFAALHDTKSEAKLSLRINNKSFVSKIVHSHDHAGHKHASQPNSKAVRK